MNILKTDTMDFKSILKSKTDQGVTGQEATDLAKDLDDRNIEKRQIKCKFKRDKGR